MAIIANLFIYLINACVLALYENFLIQSHTNSLILLPFYGWGNWSMERLSDLTKVTKLVHGGTTIWTQILSPPLVSIPCCLILFLEWVFGAPCHSKNQVMMLVTQFDTTEKLRGRVAQAQMKGIMGHFFKVPARKRAKPREGWAQAMARWMTEFSQDVGFSLCFGPSLCVLGRSSLPLDLHSFICTMRGWSKALLVLTFQRLRTHA